jgi:hypothetical protein
MSNLPLGREQFHPQERGWFDRGAHPDDLDQEVLATFHVGRSILAVIWANLHRLSPRGQLFGGACCGQMS